MLTQGATESSTHAADLIKQTCLDEGVSEGELYLHSDNGKPMKGATMLSMLEQLGVCPSFSRPSVSDDNPFSESLFKTVKYHHTFPYVDCFSTLENARDWMEHFTVWYNTIHIHSGIKFVTPEQRHNGQAVELLAKRKGVYESAKARHPNRWSGETRNWTLPDEVTLNPDRKQRYKTMAASSGCLSKSAIDGAGEGIGQAANAVRQQEKNSALMAA